MNTVRVEYYALFREQAGLNQEELQTDAEDVGSLYKMLQERYGFALDPTQLRVAVNAEFREWNYRLQNGDSVVFIPPVAGG